jgi:DNA-binding transcriptional MerR regulator
MKNYSQITFEFQDPPAGGENPGVGVRIKSLKKVAEEIARQTEEQVEDLELSNEQDLTGKLPKSTRGRKSLKTIDEGAGLINIPPDEQLFQKQYYSIGEVADMFHVNQSLLRFWESEFDIIQPRKNRKGDRHFRPVDIKNLLLIHDLLRRRKLTIEGAKDFLKKNKRSPERFAMIQSLQKIKGFLLEIKATL